VGQYTNATTDLVSRYELMSDVAKGTVTIALGNPDPSTYNDYYSYTSAVNITQCTATFKIVAGYALDLAPPPGAKCPTNAVSVRLGGRSFCHFCPNGQYKKASTGKCVGCPAGSYQDLVGGTSCKKCPAGRSCP
jgi:hypothetical protein